MEVVMNGMEELATTGRVYGNPVSRALLGLLFAASIIALGILGPPLTAQSVPALKELSQNVLMFDREFERYSLRSQAPFAEILASMQEDSRHTASTSLKSRRGDVR